MIYYPMNIGENIDKFHRVVKALPVYIIGLKLQYWLTDSLGIIDCPIAINVRRGI